MALLELGSKSPFYFLTEPVSMITKTQDNQRNFAGSKKKIIQEWAQYHVAYCPISLKGHSQLWDRADLDTTFASLKSVYLIRGGRRNSLEERKIRGNNPESLIQTH